MQTSTRIQTSTRWRAVAILVVMVVGVAAEGAGAQTTSTTRPAKLYMPQYGLALTIPPGWRRQQEGNASTALVVSREIKGRNYVIYLLHRQSPFGRQRQAAEALVSDGRGTITSRKLSFGQPVSGTVGTPDGKVEKLAEQVPSAYEIVFNDKGPKASVRKAIICQDGWELFQLKLVTEAGGAATDSDADEAFDAIFASMTASGPQSPTRHLDVLRGPISFGPFRVIVPEVLRPRPAEGPDFTKTWGAYDRTGSGEIGGDGRYRFRVTFITELGREPNESEQSVVEATRRNMSSVYKVPLASVPAGKKISDSPPTYEVGPWVAADGLSTFYVTVSFSPGVEYFPIVCQVLVPEAERGAYIEAARKIVRSVTVQPLSR